MAQGLRVSLLAPELPGQELGAHHLLTHVQPRACTLCPITCVQLHPGGSSKEPAAEVLAASLCWWKAGAASLKVVAVVVAV